VNLDLFRLLVFVTVVDRNGYSTAARRLNLTQPTVSHHIRELERTCGTDLLHYRDRAVQLTAAGQEVYRAALGMLAAQDNLRASLAAVREGRTGRVRLGAGYAFEQRPFLTKVIAPFCRSHRGTLLSLRFGQSRREAMAVLDRELDLAYVIRWHLPDEVRLEVLHQVQLTFLAASDHPLAAQESVAVDDIVAAGLIAVPLTSAEAALYHDLLREVGVGAERSTVEIEGQQARVMAASAGLGVLATFVPDSASDTVFESLVRLPVPGPLPKVDAGLVRRPGEPLSDTSAALADWLRRRCPSGGTSRRTPG
jgi:DNA-binding transcriptional LysR family regulator